MKKIYPLLLAIMALNLCGFTILNQRSHYELDWKQLETENITVVYHDPFDETAVQTAAIAEETFKQLAKSYDFTPNKKIKIYISDQDDIVNGYTAMTDHIAIWIGQNDYVHHFTGRNKWIRKVVSHEMSHFFMYSVIWSWADNLFPYQAFIFPRDFSEGYAMYFSGEEWGYGRSDASLRKGVLSNDLSMETTRGYFYATGFSMIKYLSSLHGEEKLQDLLKYKNVLGVYSFEDAFKKVYHKEFEDFQEEWRRHIYTYYYGEIYNKKDMISASDSSSAYDVNGLTSLAKEWHNISKVIVRNENVLLYGKKYKDQQYYDLYNGTLNSDSLQINKLHLDNSKELLQTERILDMDMSSEGKFVTYSKYARSDYGSIRKKIYTINTENKKQQFRGRGNHAVVTKDGDIYYHKYDRDGSRIMLSSTDGNIDTVLEFSKDTQIGDIILSTDDGILVYSKFDEKSRFFIEVYDLQEKKVIQSLETNYIVREMIWKQDQVFFTTESGKDFRTRMFLLDIASGELEEYETPVFNIRPVAVLAKNEDIKLLTFGDINRKDNPLGTVTLVSKNKSKEFVREEREGNHYNGWIAQEYEHEITDHPQTPEILSRKDYNSFQHISFLAALPLPSSDGISLIAIAQDPLAKHMFTLAATSDYDFDSEKAWYSAGYINRSFWPTLSVNYSKFKWFAGMADEEVFIRDVKKLQLGVSMPVDYLDTPFFYINYGLGMDYTDSKMSKESDSNPELFEDGEGVSVSAKVMAGYDLPVTNHAYHPVKKAELSYLISGAADEMGMNHNFTHHTLSAELGYAPLHSIRGIDYLTLTNNSRYEWQNGKYFIQHMPGIDKFENIPVDKVISRKVFVRGNDETLSGNKLFTNSSELWLKLPEMHLEKLVFFPKVLAPSYFGVGGFVDYSMLESAGEKREFKTYGWEMKGVINLLGIPTVHRFGQAFDLDTNEDLGLYYQASIPLVFDNL